MLHSYAAIMTPARRICDHGGNACEAMRCAYACATPHVAGLCRAQTGSAFAFLSMPLSCVALAAQERHFTENCGYFSNILCRAEACTIICAASPMIQMPPQKCTAAEPHCEIARLFRDATCHDPRCPLALTGPYGLYGTRDTLTCSHRIVGVVRCTSLHFLVAIPLSHMDLPKDMESCIQAIQYLIGSLTWGSRDQ